MNKSKSANSSDARSFQIGPGMWVRLRYAARDADGEVVEDFEPELGYVHGYGGLLPALEEALDGRRAGELVRVTLPPEEAFGRRREEAVLELAREEFPEGVAAGDRFEVESTSGDAGKEGALLVLRVLEVTPEAVVVDANHPLAGQAVTFQLEILEVRPAAADELGRAEAALEAAEEAASAGENDANPPLLAEGPLLSAASLLRGGTRRYEQGDLAPKGARDPQDDSD